MFSRQIFATLSAVIVLAINIPVAPVLASAAPNRHCPPLNPALLRDENFIRSLPPECAVGQQVAPAGRLISANSPLPKTLGGPNEFGYTWDDGVALSWVDTSSGTDSGFTGSPSLNESVTVNLPFTFKYFEHADDTLYLVPRGYLSFFNYGNWPTQDSIPAPTDPNDVIAPYWAPMSFGAGSWLRYTTGGITPNRYFVAEWHNMQSGDDTLNFETILYENGNILFQYGAMTYVGGRFCGTAGIEDSRGTDGSNYVLYCDEAPSNRAVLFTRPPDSARMAFFPQQQGVLVTLGANQTFQMDLRNTGDLGDDTFELTAASPWPVTFYAADGITPLGDTDGDTFIDAGILAQGAAASIVVSVAVPAGLASGSSIDAVITATSSIDTSKTKAINLSMTVPAKFVQVFMDESDGNMSFMPVSPSGASAHSVGDNYYAKDVAVTQTHSGAYLYAWDNFRQPGAVGINEVEYVLVGQDGSPLRPVSKVVDLSSATRYTSDYAPSVAAAPDGHLALAWTRYEYDSVLGAESQNLYYAILDTSGNLSFGPVKLTNNALGAATWVYSPSITATDDNRFLLGWEVYNSTTFDDNIWVAGYNTNGAAVFAPKALTADNISWGQVLNSLPGSQVIVTSSKNSGGPFYTVLNSAGTILKAQTNLNSGSQYYPADAVALRAGRVAVAWGTAGNSVQLSILDASYNIETGPITASTAGIATGNYGLSVTTDPAGRVIMTWLSADNLSQLIAIADSHGVFLATPHIFRTSSYNIDAGWNGQGNAPLSRFGDVPPTSWAAAWVEGLAAAGITDGCGVGIYCPANQVTRDQMAVFLVRSVGITNPPPATGMMFADVPINHWAGKWIEELARRGITNGCSTTRYCPGNPVSRDQMAVFLLRAKGINPPAATGAWFVDVPINQWAAKWIEELARQGITSGCTANQYCPGNPVTRDQMAVFIVRTFGLPFDAPLP